MDPVPKRSINNGEDLISNLPDCVLAHILSKLPTKFAVGTAILSTKWKHLFSLIPQPDIDLDDSLILHPENNSESDSERRLESFEDFGNRVLKQVPSIRKFTLNCTRGDEYDEEEVFEWILAAVNLSVMFLDITNAPLQDITELLLEELISESNSLINLVLRQVSFCVPHIHSAYGRSHLRYIHFDNVTILEDEGIPVILSGCPVLYSLTMSNCSFFELEVLNVSSQSLVHLSIESCFCHRHSTFTRYFTVNAPALEEFCFSDCVMTRFEFENLDSVKVAEINVVPVEGMDDEDTLSYHEHATEFVGEFFNVEHLCLSKNTIADLHKSGKQIPVFFNLTVLHLGGFDMNGWKLLPRLLQSAPNLEHLAILEVGVLFYVCIFWSASTMLGAVYVFPFDKIYLMKPKRS